MRKEVDRRQDSLGSIVVTQVGNKRMLSFDSDLEQSSIYIDKPYYLDHDYMQAMLLGALFAEPRHVTLLGLGGGALAHCLTHYFPEAHLSVVELRQAVIDVAYEWFNLPRTDHLQVQCADAMVYLQALETKTDVIFSDLYCAEGMDASQGQVAFIEDCYAALQEHGCLVLNFHEQPQIDSPQMQRLQKLFAEVLVCNACKHNSIIVCLKSLPKLTMAELEAKATALAATVKMPLMYYYWRLHQYPTNTFFGDLR